MLRVYNLGKYSIWLDESFAWFIVRNPLSTFFQALTVSFMHPPLFYLAAKVFVSLFGMSELSLRLASVLFSVATIWVFMKLGENTGGDTGKFIGGIFGAFHPMIVWYSQDAWPYSIFLFLSSFSLLIFLKLQKSPKDNKLWGGLLLVNSLGLLTHYYFMVFVITQSVFVFREFYRNPNFFRRWILQILLAMVPLGLWLWVLYSTKDIYIGIGWIQTPSLKDIPLTLWNLVSGYGGKASWVTTLFGTIALILILFGITDKQNKGQNLLYLLGGIFLPIAGAWVMSLRKPIYIDRYLIFTLPYVVLLVSHGVEKITSEFSQFFREKDYRQIFAIFLIVVGFLAGLGIHTNPIYARENWKGLTAFMKNHSVPDETLFISDELLLLPLGFYFNEPNSIELLPSENNCRPTCWWILRQPYTPPHAFTQSLSTPGRNFLPNIPSNCSLSEKWESPTGIQAWHLTCSSN